MRRFRFLITLGVLVALLGPIAAMTTPMRAFAQDITCDDFTNPDAAQALLEADDAFEDALDPDGDGEACTDDDLDALAEEEDADDEDARDEDDDADADADEEDEESSGNPLSARLGSNREDFEDEYGEAVDEDSADEYPTGVGYEVDDFRAVDVFFHSGGEREYVVYVTLTAERRSPWSQSEAEEIALEFLPADWEPGDEPFRTDDGDLLIPGFSEAIEGRFSEATYERYGAQGDQGEVFFLLGLDSGNDVATIEIGLGNDVQEEASEDDEEEQEQADDEDEQQDEDEDQADEDDEDAGSDADADAAADSYLETVRTEFDTLVGTTADFIAIIGDPNFANDQALFDRLIEILVIWTAATAIPADLDAPAEFADLQSAFEEYTELLSGAAIDITVGLSNGDEATIQSGLEKFGQAVALEPEIEGLLSEAGA